MLKDFLVPIHRAAWPFVGAALVVAFVASLIWTPLAWPCVVAAVFCLYFFRDPERVTPARDGLVVAPADGLVTAVTPAVPPPELGMGDQARTRVSIFLSIFDVHVNRIPADGVVADLAHRPGTFVNAALDKASEDNERQSIRLTLADGRDLGVVQIAGLVARRIICNLERDQQVRAGARFGLIRFGSRLDIYLPEGASSLVASGQRMVAGETVIADLESPEGLRPGEIR